MSALERVILDVDTQFDFLDPAGALYVPGSVEIRDALDRLFDYAAGAKIPVLSSVDEHTPDDPEFAEFGPHCVKGTPGQEKLPITVLSSNFTIRPEDILPRPVVSLLSDYDQLIFTKPTLSVFDNPHFVDLVESLEVGEYLVFGVATDYCVLKEAMGLLERGRRVKIVRDAIKALGKETGEKACQTLSALGADWIETSDIVGCSE